MLTASSARSEIPNPNNRTYRGYLHLGHFACDRDRAIYENFVLGQFLIGREKISMFDWLEQNLSNKPNVPNEGSPVDTNFCWGTLSHGIFKNSAN